MSHQAKDWKKSTGVQAIYLFAFFMLKMM
ncbi:MAG: hypothetical protein ACI9LM_005287, partial [Alteromonadaceae bacterium]